MLDKDELEAFMAVAQELHFGRAAARLCISTPQLSLVIRRVERRAGAQLFHRTTRKVELTRVGQLLFDEIQPAWTEFSASLEDAMRTSRRLAGQLNVGFVTAAGSQLLIGNIRRFRAQNPGSIVQLREATFAQVWPWLTDGTIDLAVLPLPSDEPGVMAGADVVAGTPLLTTSLTVAVHAAHPFARTASVTLSDLARTSVVQLPESVPSWLRRSMNPTLALDDGGAHTEPVAHTVLEALSLAAAGNGVALLDATTSHYNPRPDLRYVPVSDASPLTWGLVWQLRHDTAAVRTFDRCANGSRTLAAS